MWERERERERESNQLSAVCEGLRVSAGCMLTKTVCIVNFTLRKAKYFVHCKTSMT